MICDGFDPKDLIIDCCSGDDGWFENNDDSEDNAQINLPDDADVEINLQNLLVQFEEETAENSFLLHDECLRYIAGYVGHVFPN